MGPALPWLTWMLSTKRICQGERGDALAGSRFVAEFDDVSFGGLCFLGGGFRGGHCLIALNAILLGIGACFRGRGTRCHLFALGFLA